MKKFITFAVNNPVTILMMVLAIMLLGKISYDKLSVDLLPDLNNPKLFVDINTGEKPPEEVEKQFVERMESVDSKEQVLEELRKMQQNLNEIQQLSQLYNQQIVTGDITPELLHEEVKSYLIRREESKINLG